MTDEADLLKTALAYAARGWRVLPLHTPVFDTDGQCTGCDCGKPTCKDIGKHPRTGNGVYDATTDPETIRRWWSQWPAANIGIATGPENGIVAIDVDGPEQRAELDGKHVPPTPSVQSGRENGGCHIYFDHPPDPIGNPHVGALLIRGAGGYLAAPPSLHYTGRRYEWTIHPDDVPLAPCPAWIVEAARAKPEAGDGFDLTGLVFNPDAIGPTERIAALLESDPVFAARYRRERFDGDGHDQSPSAHDLGLATRAFVAGFTPQEVVNTIIALRRERGDKPRTGRGDRTFWSDTLGKAHTSAANTLAQAEEREALAAARLEEAEHMGTGPTVKTVEPVARVKSSEALPWCPAEAMADSIGEIQWLWPSWVPRGHLSILAGEPGSGKSAIALYLAACVTQHLPWPDGEPNTNQTAPVLLADSEGAQAVFLDRMRRWGIETNSIFFPGEAGFGRVMLDDPKVLAAVRQRVTDSAVGFVIIDSLRTALGTKLDENSSAVADVLTPWQELARDTGIALLITHHFAKRQAHQDTEATLDRLRGSTAIGATGKSIIAIDTPDPQSPFSRLSVVKSNLTLRPEPIGFAQHETGIEWAEAPQAPHRATVLDEAMEYLKASLERRPVGLKDLMANKPDGVSQDSIYRARKRLGIVAFTDDSDPKRVRTLWGLPSTGR